MTEYQPGPQNAWMCESSCDVRAVSDLRQVSKDNAVLQATKQHEVRDLEISGDIS